MRKSGAPSTDRRGSLVIGLLTFDLHLPACRSLKDKRFILRSLKERVQNRFNVAVAEVGFQDLWQRAALAVVTVSGDRKVANSVLSRVADLASSQPEAMLLDLDLRFL